MIDIEKLKEVKNILNEESINNCIASYGTKEFSLLVETISTLSILIKRLENPKKTRKLDKLMND